MVEKIINIMGGELFISITSNEQNVEKVILNFCLSEIKKLVSKLNFFDDKSILSILNKDKNIDYDEDLFFLINESILLYKKSFGKFNIFLGEEILNRKNNFKENDYFDKNIDIDNIMIMENSKIILNVKNVKIDFGGIAKGYILDVVVKKIKKKFDKIKFDIILDARGDILVDCKKNIDIEVENPFDDEITFEIISLNKGSIITSGHNKQKFKFGSHILGDENDIFTITLVSNVEETYKLDAFGTWLIQEKSDKVLELLEFDSYFKDIEGLIILKNGKILKTCFWNSF